MLAPVPAVLVSCGNMEKPNLFTVAWTGITNTQPPKTYISVRKSRYSYGLIQESGEFVINLTTAAMVKAVDFCGVRSGRDLDKFAHCALTPIKAPDLDAPMVEECPLSLECRVTQVIELGSHDLFLADIIGVAADESLMSSGGRLMLDRADLMAYCHGEYFTLGKKIGKFGFSVQKKKKKPKHGKK